MGTRTMLNPYVKPHGVSTWAAGVPGQRWPKGMDPAVVLGEVIENRPRWPVAIVRRGKRFQGRQSGCARRLQVRSASRILECLSSGNQSCDGCFKWSGKN